ncbi:MAG: putative glycosyl transferase, group 1 [Candidatus Eremiobacteraeota bacterium]|nr:putative glycosyl transferase, group 1 [Candidatus Eremiobacteraeota bacterium]
MGETAALRVLQLGMTGTRERGGGLDVYFFNLLRALPPQGVRTRALIAGDASGRDGAAVLESFAPDDVGMFRRWSALRRSITRSLAESDVVVSHFAPYAFPVLDRLRSRPHVVHFHGSWALEGASEGASPAVVLAKTLLERIVYARGARFIVLSRAYAQLLAERYRVNPDAISVVPGGVDLDWFHDERPRSEVRRALGWPTDRPTVVAVRRLVRAKGIENLIDAVDALRRVIPDVLLVIAGTGPLEETFRSQVASRGLERWVHLTGFVDPRALPAIYRAADVSIVPTTSLEGFGLVALEALACGTPALVTPVSGLPDTVNMLDPALVLDGCDARSLARGLSDALTGRIALPSEEACIRYVRGFSWPAIAGRIADIYRAAA